jgi:hypothetical protein
MSLTVCKGLFSTTLSAESISWKHRNKHRLPVSKKPVKVSLTASMLEIVGNLLDVVAGCQHRVAVAVFRRHQCRRFHIQDKQKIVGDDNLQHAYAVLQQDDTN